MKPILKIFVVIFLLTTNGCSAQKMVQTISDAQKIEVNKEKFIGKPLKTLFNEIVPPIKVYMLQPGGIPRAGNTENIGNLSFSFVDPDEYFKNLKKGHRLATILVYVNEKLNDDQSEKPQQKRYKWTKGEEKKYENFTIAGIRVYGKN